MEYKDNFKNYESDYKQLIGKWVLYEFGRSYDREHRNRSLVKITKVTKTGFRIGNDSTALFDFDGWQKGLTGRMEMGTISNCKLLTEEEKIQISTEWIEKKKKKELIEEITKSLTINLPLSLLEKFKADLLAIEKVGIK